MTCFLCIGSLWIFQTTRTGMKSQTCAKTIHLRVTCPWMLNQSIFDYNPSITYILLGRHENFDKLKNWPDRTIHHRVLLCFSVILALRLPRLGKRVNLSAFRAFVRFVLVWFCRFPFPLGVSEGLRFVIVELPGLFSFLFFFLLFSAESLYLTLNRAYPA